MFAEPLWQVSEHARSGAAQMFSEFVATFGLLSVIWSVARKRSDAVAVAVGLTSPARTGSRPRPRSPIPL